MNTSNDIIISYFYNKKTSAIYVACVSGGVRGGGGVGGRGKGMGIWKGKKRDTCYKTPPPPSPIIEKRETLIQPEVMTI